LPPGSCWGIGDGPAIAAAADRVRLQPLLVKHDKDNGHGRKLGHYKHHRDDDWRWSSSRRGSYARDWPYATPRLYGAPGYGSSMPPAYYAPPTYYGMPY